MSIYQGFRITEVENEYGTSLIEVEVPLIMKVINPEIKQTGTSSVD